MPDIKKDLLLSRIRHSGDFTALEKRYLEQLIRGSDYTEMRDTEFMTDIISRICNYALANQIQPTDTVRTVGENLEAICDISNFDGWKGGQS